MVRMLLEGNMTNTSVLHSELFAARSESSEFLGVESDASDLCILGNEIGEDTQLWFCWGCSNLTASKMCSSWNDALVLWKRLGQCHLKDGSLVSACWKGWCRDGSTLRWEVRRLLPACGYMSSAKQTEGAKLKDNWPVWKNHLHTLGLAAPGVDFGDSKRASMKRAAASTEQQEELHWFSTKALLGFLLYLSKNKGDRVGKARNAALLDGLLLNTLDAEDARLLVAEPYLDEHRRLCRRFVPESECCPHSLEIRTEDRPPQTSLSAFLLEGFLSWDQCMGHQAWLKHVLDRIAMAIENNVDAFADYEYHTTSEAFLMGPSGKKRRVLDPHLKSWANQQVAATNQPSHSYAVRALANVNKSIGTSWRQEDLSILRAAMHVHFRNPLSVAVVLDASRIGRPSKELLCGVVHMSDCAGSHAVLPPQAESLASFTLPGVQFLDVLKNCTCHLFPQLECTDIEDMSARCTCFALSVVPRYTGYVPSHSDPSETAVRDNELKLHARNTACTACHVIMHITSKICELSEVIADGTTLGIRPMESMSEQEMDSAREWGVQALHLFLEQAASEDVEAKQKLKKHDFSQQVNAARKSNRQWLVAMDGLLKAGLGYGLQAFMVENAAGPLPKGATRYKCRLHAEDPESERACIVVVNGSRYVEVPRSVIRGVKVPGPSLHIASDMGPVGKPALSYIRTRLNVRCTVTFDLYHRLVNDWVGGLTDADLLVVRLEYKSLVKAREGAFSTHSNHSLLNHISKEFFELFDSSNELFQVMYDSLVMEDETLRGDPDIGEPAHMEKTWERCKSIMTSRVAGETPSLSRWWSYETSSRVMSRQKSLHLMVLLWLGYRRKWYKNVCDPLLGFLPAGRDESEAVDPVCGESGLDLDGGADDDGEVEAEPHAHTVSKARAVAQKNRSAASTLRYALQLLCDSRRTRLWQGMVWLPRPLQIWFESAVHECKSIDSNAALQQRLCDNELLNVVGDVLHSFFSCDMGARMGMMTTTGESAFRTPFKQKEDEFVAQHIFKACVRVCGQLAVTSFAFKSPPMCFMPLLSEVEGRQASTLEGLKKCWQWLEKLELEANENEQTHTWLQNLVFVRDVWVRELLILLWEKDWLEVPPVVALQLKAFGGSFLSSLIVEEGFNEIRRVSSLHRGQKCEPSGAWHVFATGQVLKEHGRGGVDVTAEAEAAAARHTATLHYPKDKDCSIPQQALEDLTAERPSKAWPHPSPQNYRNSALAWLLLDRAAGNWDEIEGAWKSLLLSPGMLFFEKGIRTVKLVLSSSQYGFISVRVQGLKDRVVKFPVDIKNHITFDFVKSVRSLRVTYLKLHCPGSTGGTGGTMQMTVSKEHTSLLEHAAKSGFSTLTLPRLKQLALVEKLSVPGAGDRVSEKDCLTSLLKHVHGDSYTEDMFTAAWAARKGKEVDPLLSSELFQSVEKQDIFDPENFEDAEMAFEWDQLHAKQQRVKRDSHMKQTHSEKQEPLHEGSASSSSAPAAPPKERKFVTYRADGYHQDDASKLLPETARIFKDLNENRWRLTSKLLPNSGTKSKSWGKRSGISDFSAMLVVVKAAWQAHFDHTGEACPWDFAE
eukprot:6491398-Amphidinium_carterae.2